MFAAKEPLFYILNLRRARKIVRKQEINFLCFVALLQFFYNLAVCDHNNTPE